MSVRRVYKTAQEDFWAGDFGVEYIQRNCGVNLLASNLAFFAKSLRSARNLNNCIEFGANVGMNLLALKMLYPNMELHGIEINATAVEKLKEIIPQNNVFHDSIINYSPSIKYDLVLIKGVLIHIDPSMLSVVYEKLFSTCSSYLLIAEYYNPTPVALSYRGHEDKLFKRDFAGEIMDAYPQLDLVDYGFAYRRDKSFPQDDINWFLLRRN